MKIPYVDDNGHSTLDSSAPDAVYFKALQLNPQSSTYHRQNPV